MWDYVNMDVMFVTILEVEQVLVKLGETLFEPLKEEQEDGIVVNAVVEKQINVLNESFINFFKQGVS